MNRKQLILIFLALIIIGGAGLMMLNRKDQSWSAPAGKMGEKLFPNFPINDIAVIHIKGQDDLHLDIKDGTWRVQERGNYPANFSQIKNLLLKLADLKISQSDPIGASQLAHMELEQPGKGPGSGILVEMQSAQGKLIQSLILGKKHVQESSNPSPFGGGEYPDGRYVMLPSDSADVLLVSDPLTDIQPAAEPWLNRDFFKVEKPQSISFVSTTPSNSWRLVRESESSPWILAATNAGETLDSNKVSSVASTLSYASFVDVASNTSPAQTGLDKPLKITISTFDHFTYDIQVGNKTPEGNFNLSVAVTADIPTQRIAGKDEKPADKQKLDAAFQSATKTLQDKLTAEKALSPWVYLVSSSMVDPLIRPRAELLVDKNAKKPEDKSTDSTTPAADTLMPAPADSLPVDSVK